MKKLLPFLLLILVLFVGCQKQPTPQLSSMQKPSWVLNPNQNGKIGAVGIAGITYDQKPSSQRNLAITRALNELSLQKGVKVELRLHKQETLSHNQSNTQINEKSNYTSSSNIKAHIEKVWKNRLSNELYIWMVID
mgnify:CR=1 FL=1